MLLRALIPSGNGRSRQLSSPPVFGTLHREIDRLLDDFTRGGLLGNLAQNNLIPNIDVMETDDAIEVTAELPGLERKDVEISVEDDVLTIRGEKRMELPADGDGQGRSAGQQQDQTQQQNLQGQQQDQTLQQNLQGQQQDQTQQQDLQGQQQDLTQPQGQQLQGQQRGQLQQQHPRNYLVAERSYGVFMRGLQMPPGVDPSQIEASMSNGILRIRIPKPRKAEPRKVEVKDTGARETGSKEAA